MLADKTGLILGVANKRSLAWGIAKAADAAGARLVITYQNDRMRRGVEPLVTELSRPPLLLSCDVSSEAEMDTLAEEIREVHGHVDFMVHGLAFARKEELDGAFRDTTLEGWQIAMQVSAYSLTALVRRIVPLMEGRRGSFLTLTYLGGQRVVPNYNIMGVAKAALESSLRYLAADIGPSGHRVNAISAGPIKTLAASGVTGFSSILEEVERRAPLRRNVTTEDVAKAALFLLSDLSGAVTGEILHVDAGFHVLGV